MKRGVIFALCVVMTQTWGIAFSGGKSGKGVLVTYGSENSSGVAAVAKSYVLDRRGGSAEATGNATPASSGNTQPAGGVLSDSQSDLKDGAVAAYLPVVLSVVGQQTAPCRPVFGSVTAMPGYASGFDCLASAAPWSLAQSSPQQPSNRNNGGGNQRPPQPAPPLTSRACCDRGRQGDVVGATTPHRSCSEQDRPHRPRVLFLAGRKPAADHRNRRGPWNPGDRGGQAGAVRLGLRRRRRQGHLDVRHPLDRSETREHLASVRDQRPLRAQCRGRVGSALAARWRSLAAAGLLLQLGLRGISREADRLGAGSGSVARAPLRLDSTRARTRSPISGNVGVANRGPRARLCAWAKAKSAPQSSTHELQSAHWVLRRRVSAPSPRATNMNPTVTRASFRTSPPRSAGEAIRDRAS
jgi:hypothetical protein